MLTKEDYMKLDKERLAELLVERDAEERKNPVQIPFVPIPTKEQGTCPFGGNCTNPFHDCINCPGGTVPDGYRINTTTGTSISCSVNDDGNFNSSTTIQPNKYGYIAPTDAEEFKSYEWIYNKGFQDSVKQAEEKMEKRLEEEWAKGNDVGYEDGKDDMLMQMPHWKKVEEDSILGEGTRGCINGNIYCDGWYVSLKELEKKLPREEGTIYCDSTHIDYVNKEGIEDDERIAEGCDKWNKFYNKYNKDKKK